MEHLVPWCCGDLQKSLAVSRETLEQQLTVEKSVGSSLIFFCIYNHKIIFVTFSNWYWNSSSIWINYFQIVSISYACTFTIDKKGLSKQIHYEMYEQGYHLSICFIRLFLLFIYWCAVKIEAKLLDQRQLTAVLGKA